mgnify:CR=1 FL=1|jgi:hypothetical protein
MVIIGKSIEPKSDDCHCSSLSAAGAKHRFCYTAFFDMFASIPLFIDSEVFDNITRYDLPIFRPPLLSRLLPVFCSNLLRRGWTRFFYDLVIQDKQSTE